MAVSRRLVPLVVGALAFTSAGVAAAAPPGGQATITVVEQADPASQVAFKFGGSLGAFTLVDDGDPATASRTFTVDPGSVRIRQQQFSAWTLGSIDCATPDGAADATIDREKGLAIVDAAAGDTITCTYSNSRPATIQARFGLDLNGNETVSSHGDRWNAELPVDLLDVNGTLVDTKLTDDRGRVQFSVSPGPYTICETVRDGFTHVKPGTFDVASNRACFDVTARGGATVWVRFIDQPISDQHCQSTEWVVSDFVELKAAIKCFNDALIGTTTSISLSSDIMYAGRSPEWMYNTRTNTQLVIEGNGHTIQLPSDANAFVVDRGTTVSINNVTLTSGRYGIVNDGDLTVANATLRDFNGSAIWNRESLEVTDSLITGNAQGIHAANSYYTDVTEITRTTITDNGVQNSDSSYIHGAGVRVTGTMLIRDSTISRNEGLQGGGIRSAGANLTIIDSTISDNTADREGGGIYASGPLTMIDSTVSGNLARTSGGGMYAGRPTLIHTTVTGNKANSAGSGIFAGSDGSGEINLIASIVSGNKRTADLSQAKNRDFDRFISGGFNVIGTTADHVPPFVTDTDVVSADPLLGPLADNGGSTLTHLPGAGSPAIDLVTGSVDAPVVDQRGTNRPNGTFSDAGSVER